MGRVCVLGSFMMDLVAYAPRRPKDGETLKGTDFAMTGGGKGFNQAVAASRAGAQTSMLGRLGKDSFGESFMETLINEEIDTSGVEIDESLGTGVGFPVVSSSGDNSIIIIPRANDSVDSSFAKRSSNLILASQVLLLQLELPINGALAAARIAKEANVCVILTPAPVAPLYDFEGLINVLVPNQVEATELCNGVHTVENQAAYLIKTYGIKAVIITMGSKGVYVTDGIESKMILAPAVNAVDSVGAGDAFCGYLGARLAAGDNLFEAAHYAVHAASFSVTRRGAALSIPNLQEVETFLTSLLV